MSTDQGASGANDTSGAGGQNQDTKPNNVEALEAKNRELLEEKRKLKEKLTAFENEKKAAEEKALHDNAEWKKLADIKTKEAEDAKALLKEKDRQEADRLKLASFLDTMDGKVDRKYWGLISLDEIAVNPETGEVDQSSVAKAVEAFKKDHPLLVQKGTMAGQPNTQPQGSGSALTYEEWKKLPVDQMKARMKEVVNKP